MARNLITAAAQMGPIAKSETRADTVARLLVMMREARAGGRPRRLHRTGADHLLPPRWMIEDEAELDSYYETSMPSRRTTQPLFDEAKKLGIGFNLGYAELVTDGAAKHRFNTSILVDKSGTIVASTARSTLPAGRNRSPTANSSTSRNATSNLATSAFPCSGPWAASWAWRSATTAAGPKPNRVMGLQGVEMVMLGYNTPFGHLAAGNRQPYPLPQPPLHAGGRLPNATWSSAPPNAGTRKGSKNGGQSVIVAPSAKSPPWPPRSRMRSSPPAAISTWAAIYKDTIFNFAQHRRPEHYGLITERTGAILRRPVTHDHPHHGRHHRRRRPHLCRRHPDRRRHDPRHRHGHTATP